jgi:hypothetical protein
VHVVARYNTRELCFTRAADLEILPAHLAEMRRWIVSLPPQCHARERKVSGTFCLASCDLSAARRVSGQ